MARGYTTSNSRAAIARQIKKDKERVAESDPNELASTVGRNPNPSNGKRVTPITRHPIYGVLREACAPNGRGLPSPQELRELEIPEHMQVRVAAACREVAKTFDSGDSDGAQDRALRLASDLLDDLPEEYQDVDYRRGNDEVPSDPRELAARVPFHSYSERPAA